MKVSYGHLLTASGFSPAFLYILQKISIGRYSSAEVCHPKAFRHMLWSRSKQVLITYISKHSVRASKSRGKAGLPGPRHRDGTTGAARAVEKCTS